VCALEGTLAQVYTVAVENLGSVLGGGRVHIKWKGWGQLYPRNFDRSVCDEIMMVTDDQAFDMVKPGTREGVLGARFGPVFAR
jgi:cysteine synthase